MVGPPWHALASRRWRGPALVAVIALAVGCEPQSVGQPSPVPCAFVLSASTVALTAAGGSASVGVSTEDRCVWSARANVDWISITTGANSAGSGTVAFTASANSDTSPRTGTLTVADKPVSVTQDAAVAPTPTPCTFVASPTSATFDKRGGADHVTITAPETCRWTVAASAAWLHITSGTEGTGNGSVTYVVDVNIDPASRASTIAVAGQTIGISQAGDLDRCEYSISVLHFSPCMQASEMTTTITTAAACPWTASSNVPWMTLTRGASTVGPGVAGFTVSENYDPPRGGQILVRWPAPTAGQNLQVSQAGCRYGVSKSAIAFPPGAGSGSFDVVQQSDPLECGGALQNACVWSAQSDVPWVVITSPMPRVGDDPVAFTVAPNTSSTSRGGTITVRDQIVRITQAGAPPASR